MATLYRIDDGETLSPLMSYGWEGAWVRLFFYDADGNEVQPTGAKPVLRRERGANWRTVNPIAPNEWAFNGPCIKVQLSLTGVTGYSSYKAEVWRSSQPVDLAPDGLYMGVRAMTTQNYVEANVKAGLQFVVATFVPAFPAAPGFTDYVVEVGALPISIKGRTFQFDGSGIQLDVFRGPTYTGGVVTPYYNLLDGSPNLGLAVIKGAPTVTNVGTRIAPTRTLLGSSGVGNTVVASSVSEAEGLETILQRNTTYLFRTTSLHVGGTQRVSSANTWYEGELDLPLK